MTRARTWLVLVIAGLLGLTLLQTLLDRQDAENRPLPPAVFKLRRINNALAGFMERHGTLPSDDRGFRYALYQLSSHLDASDFQLFDESSAAPPFWDHQEKRLVGGDVAYLNQPRRELYPLHVILLATARGKERATWVGLSDFTAMTERFPNLAPDRLLGSYHLNDGFFVIDRKVLDELQFSHGTHRVNNSRTTSYHSSENGPDRIVLDDREIRFQYSRGQVATCQIETSQGTINEIFETDDIGQIISVSRTPDNWRDLVDVQIPDSASH